MNGAIQRSGAYQKARLWLDRLVAEPEMSTATIALDQRRTERSVRRRMRNNLTPQSEFIEPVEKPQHGRRGRPEGNSRRLRPWSGARISGEQFESFTENWGRI